MVDTGNLANIAVNIATMVVSALVLGAMALGAFFFIRKWKRYSQYKCVVWEHDGTGQLKETYDKAGVFVDNKTKNKRLYLQKANVGLNPDNIPYLSTGNNKVIYFLRTGLKNFHFIKPNIKYPNITLTVGEEDVNWAINAYERSKKNFMSNILLQYMPFIVLGFVSLIILIVFIYLFNKLDVLRDTAIAFQHAADALANAQTGTKVIS